MAELTAGSGLVGTAFSADGNSDACTVDYLFKFIYFFVGGAFEAASGIIVRDEIDFGMMFAGDFCESGCRIRGVIYAVQQSVFESYHTVAFFSVNVGGLHYFRDWVTDFAGNDF